MPEDIASYLDPRTSSLIWSSSILTFLSLFCVYWFICILSYLEKELVLRICSSHRLFPDLSEGKVFTLTGSPMTGTFLLHLYLPALPFPSPSAIMYDFSIFPPEYYMENFDQRAFDVDFYNNRFLGHWMVSS